jgi:hypothetical protein
MSAVRWGVAGRIVWAWILTIPIAATIGSVCIWILERLGRSPEPVTDFARRLFQSCNGGHDRHA